MLNAASCFGDSFLEANVSLGGLGRLRTEALPGANRVLYLLSYQPKVASTRP